MSIPLKLDVSESGREITFTSIKASGENGGQVTFKREHKGLGRIQKWLGNAVAIDTIDHGKSRTIYVSQDQITKYLNDNKMPEALSQATHGHETRSAAAEGAKVNRSAFINAALDHLQTHGKIGEALIARFKLVLNPEIKEEEWIKATPELHTFVYKKKHIGPQDQHTVEIFRTNAPLLGAQMLSEEKKIDDLKAKFPISAQDQKNLATLYHSTPFTGVLASFKIDPQGGGAKTFIQACARKLRGDTKLSISQQIVLQEHGKTKNSKLVSGQKISDNRIIQGLLAHVEKEQEGHQNVKANLLALYDALIKEQLGGHGLEEEAVEVSASGGISAPDLASASSSAAVSSSITLAPPPPPPQTQAAPLTIPQAAPSLPQPPSPV